MKPPHRVLFVEDYPPFKRSFSRLLARGFGLDVTVADSGEEAIGEFGAINPELVIMDLGLPGVGGHETLQVIRALPGGDSVPVIVLTGSNDPELKRAAAQLDVEGYVLKENATDEFAGLILSVFPDLGEPIRERFRSLVGSADFNDALGILEENAFVVGRIPLSKRANRVLLPPEAPPRRPAIRPWPRRLVQRFLGVFRRN